MAPAKTDDNKLDLKVPEGYTMDAAALDKFKSSMKELGLDSTAAQKILARDLKAQKESHEETISMLKRQDAEGVKALQSEWGTKFAEKAEKVKRVFDFADPDGSFRKDLEASYLANNPKLIRFVEKFSDLVGEGKIASGTTGVPGGKDNRPLHERSIDAFRQLNKKGS